MVTTMTEPHDIRRLFEDGAAIDAALAAAAQSAVHEARLRGHPVVVWQDGQAVESLADQSLRSLRWTSQRVRRPKEAGYGRRLNRTGRRSGREERRQHLEHLLRRRLAQAAQPTHEPRLVDGADLVQDHLTRRAIERHRDT